MFGPILFLKAAMSAAFLPLSSECPLDGSITWNFKSSVSDNRLHDAFAGFWSIMARLQPIPPYSRGRAKQGDLL